MKIQLSENKVFFENNGLKKEIHPFWLRERVDGEEFLDKGTQQRLFDPSTMSGEIIIKKAQIKNGFLEIDFNDGVNSKLDISKLESEFSNKDTVIKSIPKKKWDSTLKNIKNFEYKEGFFESKEMYDLLVSFYEFGFVVIKNVDKIKFTGKKFQNKKYYRHTGHPGGIKETTPEKLYEKKPAESLKLAVKRMLPGGPLAKKQMSKLKIYRGDKHPHEVQKPKEISLSKMNKKNLLRN